MGKHRSSFEEKVVWLVRNSHVWHDWPRQGVEKAIIAGMRQDGLISILANDHDIGDFGKAVGEARDRMRRNRRALNTGSGDCP